MIKQYSNANLTWVDVLSPTEEDIREIFERFAPPLEFLHDLSAPVPRTETICSGGVVKVTMDFPVVKRTDMRSPHEIKFIILESTLITVRYEDITAIHQFQKEFEVMAALNKAKKNANGAHLFFALLYTLYASLATKLDYLETLMIEIEEDITEGQEKNIVLMISDVSRRIISFRHTLKAHDEVLETLQEHLGTCFEKTTAEKIDDIYRHYIFLMRRIETIFVTLQQLRDTNFALLSTKQNETMKLFTIMAFITFPLTLFSSMFGMNTVHTPILGLAGDFWIIVATMSFITIGFFAFFKYKHWM